MVELLGKPSLTIVLFCHMHSSLLHSPYTQLDLPPSIVSVLRISLCSRSLVFVPSSFPKLSKLPVRIVLETPIQSNSILLSLSSLLVHDSHFFYSEIVEPNPIELLVDNDRISSFFFFFFSLYSILYTLSFPTFRLKTI